MSGTHASSDPGEPTWVTEVLNFWFQDLGGGALVREQRED